MTRNFFLQYLITCSANMFLPVISKYSLHFVCEEIRKYLEVKYVPKQRELLQKFCVSQKILWEPGSLAPWEYPTLDKAVT